jgi:ABC-type polysaccharide/polyol phosphate transport system ATPase subunit
MREMMAKAHLMVLVTHDLESLKQMCNRAVWMDHGRVVMTGEVGEVLAAFRDSVQAQPAAAA